MLLTEYDEELHMRNTYKEGYEEGEQAGYSKGYIRGEESMIKLIEILTREERYDDLKRIAIDKEYRRKLFEDYNLK